MHLHLFAATPYCVALASSFPILPVAFLGVLQGFDIRGDVKIFDFGLCKSLSPSLKARDGGYGYRLTGRAGSLPYMAPEVVKMETYDTKCDVYSFSGEYESEWRTFLLLAHLYLRA